MKNLNESFKAKLHDLLSPRGTQKRVAIETGIRQNTLSNWANPEKTQSVPDVISAFKISRSIGVSIEFFFDGEPSPQAQAQAGSRLSKQEEKLLTIFSHLPEAQQRLIIEMAETSARASGIDIDYSGKQERAG